MSLEALEEIEKMYPILSKCPFCNSPASPNSHLGKCWMECHQCGARGPKFSFKSNGYKPAYENAIIGWENGVRKE